MTLLTAPQPQVVLASPSTDPLLTGDVLAHLDAQLASARTLLAIVLDQGKAIRERNVQEVVRHAGRLHAELQRRRQIDEGRAVLLEQAAARLQIASGAVTLEALTALMDFASAAIARRRSAELRGLLDEVQREHIVNRALMGQELAFLDHLLRLVDVTGSGAYGKAAARPSTQPDRSVGARRILDMKA
ncbi:MAG: flagellar export chaperone FlgN [Solirubrobacteraceae bacterium]|jgi:hypothetical protein